MSRLRTRGFTLLEVLLAFTLMAGGLGLLVAIQSGGLRQVRQGATISEASLHAQSLLDSLGVLEPISPGNRVGEFDAGRYRWQLSIEPIADPMPAAPVSEATPAAVPDGSGTQEPVIYRVSLEVRWGDAGPGSALHFVTLRSRQPPRVLTP